MTRQRGFTLIEILAVIAIVIVLTTISFAAFSAFRNKSVLNEARAAVLSELNLARSQTLASEDRVSWGVHFEVDHIIRFRGSSFSPSDPNNRVILMPSGIQIGLISLGGPSEIIFERLTGRSGATGFIRLERTADQNASTTINIYASGIAE